MRATEGIRYAKVYVCIWKDFREKGLSDDARLLYLYLLSSPHSNMLGAYLIPIPYMVADLGYTEARLTRALDELTVAEMVDYDRSVDLVVITKYAHYNPIANPNIAKHCLHLISLLPRSPLLATVADTIEARSGEWTATLVTALRSHSLKDVGSYVQVPTVAALPKPVRKKSGPPPEAEEVYARYCTEIRNDPSKKRDALKNIAALLDKGVDATVLLGAITRYKKQVVAQDTEEQFRYTANNFFGQKAYYEGYLEDAKPAATETTPRIESKLDKWRKECPTEAAQIDFVEELSDGSVFVRLTTGREVTLW